jgi:hypothetical protein
VPANTGYPPSPPESTTAPRPEHALVDAEVEVWLGAAGIEDAREARIDADDANLGAGVHVEGPLVDGDELGVGIGMLG